MKWRHYLFLDDLLYEITDCDFRPKIGESVGCPAWRNELGEVEFSLLDVSQVFHWMDDRYTVYYLEWEDGLEADQLRAVGWATRRVEP